MEALKVYMNRVGRWFAAGWRRLRDGVAGVFRDREKRTRAAYYAGLALLLAMLGLGSHAWRVRGQTRADAPGDAPREAMAVRLPTLAPVPEATPVPVVWGWPLEGEVLAGY